MAEKGTSKEELKSVVTDLSSKRGDYAQKTNENVINVICFSFSCFSCSFGRVWDFYVS